MTRQTNTRILGTLLVLTTSFFYGIMPAFTQKAFESGLAVESVLFGRYVLGTTLIWIYITIRRQNIRIGWKNIALLQILGLITFVCTTFMSESYQYLPGAIASLLVFMYVPIVMIVEIVSGKERPYTSRIVSLFICLVGLVLVVYTPPDAAGLSLLGMALAFTAGVFYAISAIGMGARRLEKVSAEVVMGFMFLISMVANLIRCLISGAPLVTAQPEQMIWVVILGIGPGFIAPIAFCSAIKFIGPSTAAMINTAEPVFAYISGILLMGDIISVNSTIGGIMIVIAILILNTTEHNRVKHDKLPKY